MIYGRLAINTIILFLFCFGISIATASPSNLNTQWISPENVKTFQALEKETPSQFTDMMKPITTYEAAIDQVNKTINHLQYINIVFKDSVDYSYSVIQNNSLFHISTFKQDANFTGITFLKNTDFSWSKFNSMADFKVSKFNGDTFFFNNIFLNATNFDKAIFFKTVLFKASQFQQDAGFSNSVFYKNADFGLVVFNGKAIFSNAVFEENVDFRESKFNGLADFSRSHFNQKADFSQADFLGPTSFDGVTLPLYLNFSNIKIKTEIDLMSAIPNPEGKTKINLLNSPVEKMKIRYRMFKLDFPKDTPTSSIDFLYTSIMESLKANGFDDGYHQIATEFYEYQYLRENHYILNAIDKYWWDYGFDKPRIFLWVLVVILFFTIINSFIFDWLMDNAYEIGFLKKVTQNESIKRIWFLSLIYNIPYAFLYTVYMFFGRLMGFKINTENFKSKNYFVNLYLVLIIASGLLCAIFAFNSIFRSAVGSH